MEEMIKKAEKMYIEAKRKDIRRNLEYGVYGEISKDQWDSFIEQKTQESLLNCKKHIIDDINKYRFQSAEEIIENDIKEIKAEFPNMSDDGLRRRISNIKAEAKEKTERYNGIVDEELDLYIYLRLYKEALLLLENCLFYSKDNVNKLETIAAIENIERLSETDRQKKESLKAKLGTIPISLITSLVFGLSMQGLSITGSLIITGLTFAAIEATFGLGFLVCWFVDVKKKPESIKLLKELGIYDYLVERLGTEKQLELIEKEGVAIL